MHCDFEAWKCLPGRHDELNTFFQPTQLHASYIPPPSVIIPFNSRMQGIRHFFIDDYRFERIWSRPSYYIDKIVEPILQPDFSMYTDWPIEVNQWNNYRKWWLASLWQNCGKLVIPVPGWTDESSFKWAFEHYSKGGIVAICSMGCQKFEKEFNLGFYAMVEAIEPEVVWMFGKNIPRYKCIEYKYNFNSHAYRRI